MTHLIKRYLDADCKKCNYHFTIKNNSKLESFINPQCPYCGSENVKKEKSNN
jgi:transposase-like protein